MISMTCSLYIMFYLRPSAFFMGKATLTTKIRTKFYIVGQTQNDFPVYDWMLKSQV